MIAPASGPYTPVVHLSYPAYGKVLDRVLSRISLELHCDLSIFTAAIRAVYSSLVIDPSARSCYQSLIVANPFLLSKAPNSGFIRVALICQLGRAVVVTLCLRSPQDPRATVQTW
jgi:hypothetical protein